MSKDTPPLEKKIDDLEHHLETIRQEIEDLVDRNARKVQNKELYQERVRKDTFFFSSSML